jgi:aquaporin Z
MSSVMHPTTNETRSGSRDSFLAWLGSNKALGAARAHWPEYLMESLELGLFMLSACTVTTILYHPNSPAVHWIAIPFLRMFLTGLAMAATLLLLIYSPWGKQSGAHMNPATTLMFARLGKIERWDAVFYILFQFLGGLAGVLLSAAILSQAIAHPDVNYAATQPGHAGVVVAFFAELFITFVLATTVLWTSNHKVLFRFTPVFAATLVAIYITFEAPFSGMSMNPARTLASAIPAHAFRAIWIYFTAPLAGMFLASEFYVRMRSVNDVYCAKYHHNNNKRCIFRCRFAELVGN